MLHCCLAKNLKLWSIDLKKPMFSVIVTTYNSDLLKTKRTLYSILMQKKIDFELIIVDDGSDYNNFDQIKDYLESANFNNYTLIANEKNLGTVKNVLSGLKIAKGDFVKLISPGDFLYDDEVLNKMYSFAKENDASIYFTNNYYYYIDEYNNPIIKEDRKNPIDLKPYLNSNLKQIKKNYLCNRDYILGAGVFEKTSDLLNSLLILEPVVKYAEDTSMIYMIASNKKVRYMDFGGVWYEDGTGISTKENSPFQKALYQDNMNVFQLLLREKKLDYISYYMCYSKHKIVRLVCTAIRTPDIICNKIKKLFGRGKYDTGWKYKEYDITKLLNILERT